MIARDLATRLDAVDSQEPTPPGYTPAAVLVSLCPEGGSVDLSTRLVLTRRAAQLRHHAGQIAFPGGKPEPHDCDLVATAIREAREEVALPADGVRVLGRLRGVPVPSGFWITPYVALVEAPWSPRAQEAEVAEVLRPSLGELTAPGVHVRGGTHEYRGTRYVMHEFRIADPPLWGATARMTHDLLARMELIEP